MASTPAFERLSHDCAQRGWALAFSLTRNFPDADDVMQKAYLVVWQRRELIPDEPWHWFAQVVVNCVREFRRKEARVFKGNALIPAAEQALPTDIAVERGEARAQLFAALESLAPEEQEAIALCHIGGLSHTEASLAADIPLNTLKARVRRGMERLRQRIKPQAASIEALLGVAIVPPPHGGWELAISRWEQSATTAVVSGSGTLSMLKVLAISGVAAAGVAVTWLAVDVIGQTKGSGERIVATDEVSSPASSSAVAQSAPAVQLVDRPVSPPTTTLSPPVPSAAEVTLSAEPSGPVAVGTARICYSKYSTGQLHMRWTERITATGVVAEGDFVAMDRSGGMLLRGAFVNGLKEGEWTEFHANGAPKWQGNYSRDQSEGYWVSHYDDGTKQSEGICVGDESEGEWKSWYRNGNLKRVWQCLKGKFHGESTQYDESGRMTSKTTWRRGERHGQETVYDADGNAVTIKIYENNKLIQTTTEQETDSGD